MSTSRFVVERAEAGERLDVFLARRVEGLSRSRLAQHIGEGLVTVAGERATPSRKVRAGEAVEWSPPAVAPSGLVPEAIPLAVLHEDERLIVLDKAAGMVVHPAPGHEAGTLVHALLARCPDLPGIGGEVRPGIVHRLDKDTSGVMVVAKDEPTLVALGAAFKAHDIERQYAALVVGAPALAEGRVATLHGRDPRDRKKFSVRVRSGRKAITAWRVEERLGAAALITATLETGRTHQVRLHLAALGHPIVGDAVYGRRPRDPEVAAVASALGRQALHARVLGFRHPATGAWMRFEAEPPPDFAAALAALRRLA